MIDPLFLKVGKTHEPPILIMSRGELEKNLSLEERAGGAQKVRLVNYAGTSFLANNEVSTGYPSEWREWFERALNSGTIFRFVLTKPDSLAAKDAEKYKMYPESGTDIDKSTLIRKNQEVIQELVEKYPGIKLSARFTEVALPYALFETTFSDSTKNHIKVDLYSPLTQHDLVRPSFMVYQSKNPLLYRHFTTVINNLEDPNNSEKVILCFLLKSAYKSYLCCQ